MLAAIDLPGNQFFPTAIPILWDGRAELAATLNATVTVATLQLQTTYIGLIFAFGITVRDPTYDYSGSIQFNLIVNNAPFMGSPIGPWTLQRGSVSSLIPTLIKLPMAALVSLTATRIVASALAQTIDFMATGLTLPRDSSKQKCDDATYRV